MVASIGSNGVEFVYSCTSDAPKIKHFVDTRNLQNETRFSMQIDMLIIDDHVCNNIEYVLGKIPKIDSVTFMYRHSRNINIHDSIAKLLYIFNNIDELYLNTSCFSTGSYFSVSATIRFFLRNISTKKLVLYPNLFLTNNIVKIINNNNNIKCIRLIMNSTVLLCLSAIPVPKIDTVHIQDLDGRITKDMMIKLFQLASNLKKLSFGCSMMRRTSSCFIETDALKQIMNFVTTNIQFNELGFHYCGLIDTDIKYICSELIDCNICSIIVEDSYCYNDNSIYSIVNMIKNSELLESVNVGKINSSDTLFKVVEALANTKITSFVATLCEDMSDSKVMHTRDRVRDILSENYCLTNVSITISDRIFMYDISLESITKSRNIELVNERRFIKTKIAAQND
jgi:hypothetical protein